MRRGRCKNAQTDIGGQRTQKLLSTGKEENKEDVYSALFQGRNGEVLVQERKPGSEGIQGMEDTFLQEDRTSGASLGLRVINHRKRIGNRHYRKRQGAKQREKVLGQEKRAQPEQEVCQGK